MIRIALRASILLSRRMRKSSDWGSVSIRPIIDREAPTENMYGMYANKGLIGLNMNPITARIMMT